MKDSYQIYCEWCREHNHVPPSREWWERAVSQPRKTIALKPDFDFETEQREGWSL